MPLHKVYLGNVDYDVDFEKVERLVRKYGEVADIIMKQGYGFVSYYDLDSAEACIEALDGQEIFSNRRLKVEMAKETGQARSREIERRDHAQPNKTLFVVNFEPCSTFMDDLRVFFEQWGALERVQLKTKFAFVEFETLEQATDALQGCRDTLFNGRRLTVEYVAPDAPRPMPKEQRPREPSRAPPGRRAPYDQPRFARAPPSYFAHNDRAPPPHPHYRAGYQTGRLERSRPPPSYRTYATHPQGPYTDAPYEEWYEARMAPLRHRGNTGSNSSAYTRADDFDEDAYTEVDPDDRFDPVRPLPAQQRHHRSAPRHAAEDSAVRRKHRSRSTHTRSAQRYSSASPPLKARCSPSAAAERKRSGSRSMQVDED